MSEQQFEDFLKRNASDYNAPPAATPRDEMWSAIAEARAARRPAAAPGSGAATVVSMDSRRPLRRYAPWIGMAATLLVGIGIGRFMLSSPAPSTLAQADSSAGAPTSPTVTVVSDSPAGEILTMEATDSTAGEPLRTAPLRNTPLLPQARLVSASPSRTLPAATRTEPNTAFTLASRDHLQRAEALVSVVAATPVDATMDSLTGKWAREMLVNTRLLLDSPAGDDPVRRRLLEDLETVLVQLIQRSGAAAEERELLDRTLERTQLLTRLRTGAAGI